MKKLIAIAAAVVIALVALTSYNGTKEVKRSGEDRLIASVTTGGSGTLANGTGTNKKD